MTEKKKLDLYALYKSEYVAPKKPILVETRTAQYLAIGGRGAPGGEAFTAAVGALYASAYTIKMTRKFAGLQDYAVCKLEGLYYFFKDADPSRLPRNQWRWKLMIRTPEFVRSADLRKAVSALLEKGKGAEVKEVALESVSEGLCVQMLHVGPYDREKESLAEMRTFAGRQGLKFCGPHHEIYLSDPRRVPPERLKTILREPVTKTQAVLI